MAVPFVYGRNRTRAVFSFTSNVVVEVLA